MLKFVGAFSQLTSSFYDRGAYQRVAKVELRPRMMLRKSYIIYMGYMQDISKGNGQ